MHQAARLDFSQRKKLALKESIPTGNFSESEKYV